MKGKFMHVVLASAFAVVSLLGGCKEKQDSSNLTEDSSPESTVTSSTATDASSVTEPEPDEDEEERSEKYRMDDKFTYLSCIKGEYSIPELSSIGNGKLLALDWKYEEDITSVQVIDILDDKIIAESSVDGYATFESATDSGLILKCIDSGEFCFMDNDLQLLKTYKPENFYGRFSLDGKKYYQIICGKLYCENVDSGELTHIHTSADLEFVDSIGHISSNGEFIDLSYDQYTAGSYDDTAAVRVNLNSNVIEMLTFDVSFPIYSDSYMYTHIFNEVDGTESLYRISLDSNECIAFALGKYDIENVPGSDYMVLTEMLDIDFPTRYIACIDDSGKCAMSLLSNGDPEECFSWFTYMPQEKLIACSASKNDSVSICLIDPSLFDYTEELEYEEVPAPVLYDEQIYEDYLASSYIPQCPERLEDLRKRADAIEDKYGIKLYISSECKDMVTQIGYDCTDDFFDSGYEYTAIDTALDEIEETLEKYPEGFLGQFRCSTGDGGIRICLTSYIHDDFSVAYSVQTGDWYNIVLDIRYSSSVNLPHELWHSTESYISNKDPDLLSNEKWMSFNPDGFEYSDAFKEDSAGISDYCYGYSDDWYFYDNYSKVNSLEDKARIMEIVMSPQVFPSEEFTSSEHVMDKLECMSDAIRQTFDTGSWGDDVFWERLAS